MRLQDYMVGVTQAAVDEAFRYARAVPADRLEWKPLDAGRSVLDLCREITMSATWTIDLLQGKPMPEWNEETMAAIQQEQEQWKTVGACQTECNRRLAELYQVFRDLPDERLEQTQWLPFEGGRDFTMREIMDYPRWNATYHLGQIAYIQTLYGDNEMH